MVTHCRNASSCRSTARRVASALSFAALAASLAISDWCFYRAKQKDANDDVAEGSGRQYPVSASRPLPPALTLLLSAGLFAAIIPVSTAKRYGTMPPHNGGTATFAGPPVFTL